MDLNRLAFESIVLNALIVVMNRNGENPFGVVLSDNVLVSSLFISRGVGTNSLSPGEVSSRISSVRMSLQRSTHSSQIKTPGPATSFRTSSWVFPQNEQTRCELFFPFSLAMQSPPQIPSMVSGRRCLTDSHSPLRVRLTAPLLLRCTPSPFGVTLARQNVNRCLLWLTVVALAPSGCSTNQPLFWG